MTSSPRPRSPAVRTVVWLHRDAVRGPDVHVLHRVVVVVQPVGHGVVGAGIAHRPPGLRRDALRGQELHRAARAEVLAQPDRFDVGGDDGRVHAVVDLVIRIRGMVVQPHHAQPCRAIRSMASASKELLLGPVVGCWRPRCAAPRRPWPAWFRRRTCGRSSPRPPGAGRRRRRLRDGQLMVHVDRPGPAAV